jgi:phosphatidylinositol alpha-mannosyltransferase
VKIGFVLDDSLDSTDGVQQYILTLGHWFQNIGHEVHYLVGETKRTDVSNVHSMCKNISVRFNGNRMSMPLPASKKHIKELLDREQFDVLHVQMPYSPFMAAKVIQLASHKTKVVGTFHILPYGKLQFMATRILFWWLHGSLKRFNTILSVSQPAALFAKKFGIESKILPNTVDLKQFHETKTPADKDQFTVVFLGRLVQRKGCMELLAAIRAITNDGAIPNLKVIIGGKGPELSKLEAYVAYHKLASIVEFAGFVAEEDKPQFLRNADLAVFPSISGESFGIVLIEAMASGSGVVIGGNNPGYSSVLESIPETLFDPKDPKKLEDLIVRIHSDLKLADTVHQQQQELVKQYSVAVVAKKLLSYY